MTLLNFLSDWFPFFAGVLLAIVALERKSLLGFIAGLLIATATLVTNVHAQEWTVTQHVTPGTTASVSGNTYQLVRPQISTTVDTTQRNLSLPSLDGCSQVDVDLACNASVAGGSDANSSASCNTDPWLLEQLGPGGRSGTFHGTLSPPFTGGEFHTYITLFGRMAGSVALTVTLTGHGCTLLRLALTPRLTPDIKDKLRRALKATNAVNGALAAQGLVCLLPGGGVVSATCELVVGIVAIINASQARHLQDALDNDPFDSLYKVVFVPVVDPLPTSVARMHWRDWVAVEQQMEATAEAIYVTVNRANSAEQVGDMQSLALQQGALDGYLAQLRTEFRTDADWRVQFAAAYPGAAVVADQTLLNAERGF